MSSCAREVSEVVDKYDNGNWKKVIVYKVKGNKREQVKAIEYYENGDVKQEVDLRKVKNYDISGSAAQQSEQTLQNQPVTPQQVEEEVEYTGPYADLMNRPGAVTRKLEGEEKERVLEAMRKRKEEQQQAEEFTEIDENGQEVTKIRQVLERFEDGSIKHEQIFIKNAGNPELEKDIEYYSNGQVRTFVPYVAGIANGRWLNYYRNGRLKTEGHSRNGTHNGEYTQYYENGKPMMKGQFVEGKMEGKWQHFWENGNLKMETVFQNDKEIGPMQKYDENGEPVKHQSPFRVGEKMNFGD
jgi:antitoxin component YwqK of YwqJK toxin-antitoxin module